MSRTAARRGLLRAAGLWAGAAACGAWPLLAAAQPGGYPLRPVRVLLGYPPGGSADVMTRLIAENLSAGLGQSFYVENKPGASGNIAARLAARAEPDGHVLLFGNPAEMVINRFLMKEPGFDPDRDFVPVVQVFDTPLALVVPGQGPHRTLAALLEATRAGRPTSFASAGSGSPGHLAGEALAVRAGVRMTHVPYKGAGPALADVIGGHVDAYFAGLTAVAPHARAGAVRILALSSAQRIAAMPDIATVAELLPAPDFAFTLWGGLFAPAATPRAVVLALNRTANEAYARADVQARMAREFSEVRPHTPEDFGAFVAGQLGKYQRVIKDLGVTPT